MNGWVGAVRLIWRFKVWIALWVVGIVSLTWIVVRLEADGPLYETRVAVWSTTSDARARLVSEHLARAAGVSPRLQRALMAPDGKIAPDIWQFIVRGPSPDGLTAAANTLAAHAVEEEARRAAEYRRTAPEWLRIAQTPQAPQAWQQLKVVDPAWDVRAVPTRTARILAYATGTAIVTGLLGAVLIGYGLIEAGRWEIRPAPTRATGPISVPADERLAARL